jgi:hypothetical protein
LDLTKRCPSGSGARRFARELGFGENHWEALPRLADLFDSQTPQPFFKGSKVSELERVKRVLKAASNDPMQWHKCLDGESALISEIW